MILFRFIVCLCKLFSTRFASSHAYKSNQHENNAAPSDTTHIKQTAFSDLVACNFFAQAIDSGKKGERATKASFFSEGNIIYKESRRAWIFWAPILIK